MVGEKDCVNEIDEHTYQIFVNIFIIPVYSLVIKSCIYTALEQFTLDDEI